MEWWLVVLLICVGVGIGLFLALCYFLYSFKDFMG